MLTIRENRYEYPLKYVDGIYRVRIADGSEWLLTTEQWYGLDVYGNPLNISMNYKQTLR